MRHVSPGQGVRGGRRQRMRDGTQEGRKIDDRETGDRETRETGDRETGRKGDWRHGVWEMVVGRQGHLETGDRHCYGPEL